MTLRLLWLEYLNRHPEGYRYTQFCAHFHVWQRRSRPPTMRRPHRAGEAFEVDWAGMTLSIIDQGIVRQAQVFVACLPCSDLTYAEASWTQGHEDWLGAHVRAFAYIGGSPKKLIPDNTKTAVTDANYWDPVLNRSYHALGRHYNVAIVPARVRKPRDKPSAENAVRLVEMWVLAPLRHRQFFSLAEANAALAEKIEEWNNRPFARLDVFLTATAVAIFHHGGRVASHPRSAAKAHHTTASEHLPPAHQAMAGRTPDKLCAEAAALGFAIGTYVDRLLGAREHPEQGVRACLGVLRSTRSSTPRPRTAWASTAICGVRPTTTEPAAPIGTIPHKRQ